MLAKESDEVKLKEGDGVMAKEEVEADSTNGLDQPGRVGAKGGAFTTGSTCWSSRWSSRCQRWLL